VSELAAVGTIGACPRCATPLEAGDLRCAVCGVGAPIAHGAPRPDGAMAEILRCDGCGAALSYAAEVGAPRCGFCGSVMHLERPADPIEQAQWLLPFRMNVEHAQEALRAWMKTLGFFRPSDLAREATVQSLQGMQWAAWIVDATALVSWTADSDAGSGRSAWAPHSGQTPMQFTRLLIPATRGLSHEEAARLTPYYDLASACPVAGVEGQQPAASLVERFEVQRSSARQQVVDGLTGEASSRVCAGECPGGKFRKVHVALLLSSMSTARVALPAYVLAYRYGGRLYRAVVHGQDTRCVFGDAPISIAQIFLVVLLGLATLGLLALLAVALLLILGR